MGTLQSKVIMITGASKGLGRAIALACAKEGAKLAISARGEKALAEVQAEAAKLGAEVLAVAGDMSQARDVERFVAQTEAHYGRIDVLMNNASVLGPSPMPYLLDYPEADFEQVLRVNAIGPFLVTRRVLPGMLQRGSGSIVNVTSSAGHVGYGGWGAYGVSKFALEGLTETWAEEVEESGVRINMVDPGEMDTAMHALAVPDCDYELADPRDVAEAFVYLASEASAHLHGRRLQAERYPNWEEEEAT
ncbi:SDR family oxidoreductase [Paenibacillus sp. J5C_2022]|uniref:SDR family NAD(P)-dependent oxidoreductase n=1 Tax=Paenibacillus sp. J5C2022 TaxID=2977129 RepID=UPI0021CED7E2|nr:SDR family oxidoreductase [Paenibacillus sp. J5C2022]MCU6709999.1 SDR family oxidoreductase [Paenibacillus sp. J5C2022]